MICPKCWTEKVHRHHRKEWPARWLACLSLVPMKCHHCYHKFYASWFTLLLRRAGRPDETAGKARAS